MQNTPLQPAVAPQSIAFPAPALRLAPPAVVDTQHLSREAAAAIATARAELNRLGFSDWPMFVDEAVSNYGVEEQLAELFPDAAPPVWHPFPDQGPVHQMDIQVGRRTLTPKVRTMNMGVMLHAAANMAMVRIPALHLTNEAHSIYKWRHLHVIACPSVKHAEDLCLRLWKSGRGNYKSKKPWKEVTDRGTEWLVRPEAESPDAVLLDPAVQSLVDGQVKGFFSPKWEEMVRRARVPYRRGILFYGPPGNGKTSLIRNSLAAMPEVSVIMVSKTNRFDDDDMQRAVTAWRDHAPCALVIEDLDTLFAGGVTVSTFLNLVDGMVQNNEKGLLLIATTNHPDKLDPAINNRPGRFDATVKFDCPNAGLRRAYFEKLLDSQEWAALKEGEATQLVEKTDGLSFAHLKEVFIRSGILALGADRIERKFGDLLAAAKEISAQNRASHEGFRPDAGPFGFVK